MLEQWRACFPESSTIPDEALARAEAATADTPLADSGLSARALSAIEQLGVATVGDLAQVDGVTLNSLRNRNALTKAEVSKLVGIWRRKFAKRGGWRPAAEATEWDHPLDAAELLLGAARTGRDDNAVAVASMLLGVTGRVGANATQQELAAALRPPVTRGRVSQLLTSLQERWAADITALELLDQLVTAVDARLTELGSVATFDELADHLLGLMTPRRGMAADTDRRTVQGLLRCALDRKAAAERAGDDRAAWHLRRREGRPILIAHHTALLDVAEALGRQADQLVADTNVSGHDEVVPAARATTTLAGELPDSLDSEAGPQPVPDGLRDGRRLTRLAATLSRQAGASASGELHHQFLASARALQYALPAVVAGQEFTTDALRERVAARFPDLASLPARPDLDRVVTDAHLGLYWDDARRKYYAPGTAGQTTGLETRPGTTLPPTHAPSGPGAIGQRLLDSHDRRSFVALGVQAGVATDQLRAVLVDRYNAVGLDLTHTLLAALHDTAAAVNIPWSHVLTADADPVGSRGHQGLRALVQRSLPAVSAAIEKALAQADGRPVALTDASLLARHDALDLLAHWIDLATPRPSALWLLVPQVHANIGAIIDGRPLPLAAPSQFVPVSKDWIDAQRLALEGAPRD